MLEPTRRVVLLGASNVTRSFATIVETARTIWNEPIEIMAAMGHGRSYGQDSEVLGRKISGIFPCALWQDLERRPPLPTVALLTDIGNDLLYGVPVERLLGWVEGCLARLEEVDATTIVTELPIANLESIGEARFRLFRRALFPRSGLTLEKARAWSAETNAGIADFRVRKKTTAIAASSAWYGFDPIHLRRRAWRQAWPMILAAWRGGDAPPIVARPTVWDRAFLWCLAPAEYSIFGRKRTCEQPSGRLRDGTTISLY